jgi:hypothetical protein
VPTTSRTVAALGVLTLLLTGGGVHFVAHSNPSTTEIDSDIAEVRNQITAAEADSKSHPDGAINIVVSLRLQTLRLTEAMLEQKRESLLRRIQLNYVINNQLPQSPNRQLVSVIETDLTRESAKLDKDQADADRSAGGLIQALALTTTATDRLTIAALRLSYYQAKYGLALPALPSAVVPSPTQAPPEDPFLRLSRMRLLRRGESR